MYRRDLRDTSRDELLRDMVTADAVVQVEPAPGPGDDRLAYLTAREGDVDLWLYDPGEGTDTRLTSGGVTALRYGRGDAAWLAWTPDGERVAVVDGDGRLATVDAETGETTALTRYDAADGPLAVDPAGGRVAVVTDHFSRGSLAVVPADGSGVTAWADDEFTYDDPRWGASLYATRSRHRDLFDYEADLVRVTPEGPEVVLSESETRVQCPRPRPRPASGAGSEAGSGDDDRDEVAFVHDGSGFDAVYLVDAAADAEPEVRELYAVEGAEVADPAWHPDGDRLAVTVTRAGAAHVHVVHLDVDGAGENDRAGENDDGGELDVEVEVLTEGRAFHTAPRWAGEDVLAVGETHAAPPAVRNVSTGERVTPTGVAGLEERLPAPESLTYENRGEEIHAVVYPPPADASDGSVPLLVKPHGGPTSFDRFRFDWRATYLAALGYAVVCPNYRGSDGFGRRFRMLNDGDWGGGDLSDVVAAADAVAEAYDAVDSARAGVYGGSGGGLMTANALGRTDRFRAGAAFYGVYDYETFVDDTDDVGFRLLKRELGFPAADLDAYRDASPIRSAADVDDPLLVLHGEDDVRVPISQSEQLVDALEEHGKRYEFRRYDGEEHGFVGREAAVDAYTRVADLFAKYLRVDPDPAGASRPHEPDDGAE